MNIFLISLMSSIIVLIALFTAVEIAEQIRYFKTDKSRIDFNKFLKAYELNPHSWELYSNFVLYTYMFSPVSYSARKNNELYFTYSDLRKYKKWKKQLDKAQAKRFFANTMAEIDRELNNEDKYQGVDMSKCDKEMDMMEGTVRQPSKLNLDTQQEFIGEIIEHFENFLDMKGIELDNPEKQEAIDTGEEEDSIANIYGTDYGWLQSDIEGSLKNWGLIEKDPANIIKGGSNA